MATRQIKLNAFMRPASIHTGAWRYPGAWPDMNFNFAHIKRSIQTLEAAKFDAFFMADHMAVLNMPMDALKRSHTVDLVRAVHAAVGAVAGDRAHRSCRHRLHHVRRALSHRPPICLARSHQRRPRRLEHRHHLQPGRRAQFRHGRAHGARRTLPARARVLRRGDRACGIPGPTTPSFATSRAASSSILRRCTCSAIRANISRCAARSTSRARFRAGR